MTEEELQAVREFTGDLLVRAFRGEVDLATGLAEIRDLVWEEGIEEAEIPEDLKEEKVPDATKSEEGTTSGDESGNAEGAPEKLESQSPAPEDFAALEAELAEAIGTVLPAAAL